MGPGGDVAAGDGEGEQVGESVGGAREGWDSEFGEDGGVVPVVYGGAVVGEREQRDDLDAGAGHGRDAGEHLLASQLA